MRIVYALGAAVLVLLIGLFVVGLAEIRDGAAVGATWLAALVTGVAVFVLSYERQGE